MFKSLYRFLKTLGRWEYFQPSSFWLCTIGLYISFSSAKNLDRKAEGEIILLKYSSIKRK